MDNKRAELASESNRAVIIINGKEKKVVVENWETSTIRRRLPVCAMRFFTFKKSWCWLAQLTEIGFNLQQDVLFAICLILIEFLDGSRNNFFIDFTIKRFNSIVKWSKLDFTFVIFNFWVWISDFFFIVL